MHKIIFFSRKKIIKKKNVPYLKFSDPLPETHLLFFGLYHGNTFKMPKNYYHTNSCALCELSMKKSYNLRARSINAEKYILDERVFEHGIYLDKKMSL